MSLYTVSTKKNRIYVRKFDHDEAVLLYALGGWSKNALAIKYGVSPAAIARVVDPVARARMDAKAKKWLMSGECVGCGGPRTRIPHGRARHTKLCRTCFGISMRTRGRFDELGQLAAVKCSTCQQWKDPGEFASDVNDALGKHEQCRPCSTKARNDYRQRRKVPCTFCGKPCLPPSEKNSKRRGYFPLPRCKTCFHDWQRVHRAGVRKRLLDEHPGIRPRRGIFAEKRRLEAARAIVVEP